jgi:hypothetical protein
MLGDRECLDGIEDVAEERSTGERMELLGKARAHPCPESSREHHGCE